MLATFVVVVLLIGSASAIFVGAYNGQRLAGLATRVQQIERALASAELTRLYLAQAAYLASERRSGITFRRTLDAANQSLVAAEAELRAYVALSPAPDQIVLGPLAAFEAKSSSAIETLRAGNTNLATSIILSDLQPVYNDLERALVDVQRAEAAEINQTSSNLGRVSDVVGFLLAFALPVAGMTAYRWVTNRQRRQAELSLRIKSEMAISKSKDEFIANVSHELRTPLTGIIGFAQILDQSNLEPEHGEVVRLIVDQSADLSRMVDDLLTAARADADALSISPRVVSIKSEVAEVVRFVELMRTEVEVDCQEAKVMIDPERYRQVLRNLLVNAHKHGGSRIKVSGVAKEDTYVCTVIDDGPGVPAHVEGRLFSRFVHTGETPVIMGSVGLGLAIVQELCRLMRCEVSYRRVRGETWFSVTIPLAVDAVHDRRDVMAASA
ncbi:MAG: sensor histidine kinase [Actinomycetota bacterium]